MTRIWGHFVILGVCECVILRPQIMLIQFSSFDTLCDDDDATLADLVSPTLGTSNKVRPGKLIFHIVSV